MFFSLLKIQFIDIIHIIIHQTNPIYVRKYI